MHKNNCVLCIILQFLNSQGREEEAAAEMLSGSGCDPSESCRVLWLKEIISGEGEEEVVDADAEVVAEHVAEEAYGDAEDNDVAVVEEGGGKRHKGR